MDSELIHDFKFEIPSLKSKCIATVCENLKQPEILALAKGLPSDLKSAIYNYLDGRF
jgi:hypothetical protein